MAVVYAVLCHRSPSYVAELVRRLHHPGHHVILHADAKAPAAMHDLLARLAATFPDVHVLDSGLCAWGGWSLVEATLRAVDRALAFAHPWRHFMLLSEEHVPLQPPATTAASLPENVSFFEAVPLTGMDCATRADLLHRFAHRYWELPGVGMFAGAERHLNPEQMRTLRLGSQWVVLARVACERLALARDDAGLWAPFRSSLIPDETALQSVLRGTRVGQGLEIDSTNKTFVIWPHLGGEDRCFTDAGVRAARAQGHLFIRKRPTVLPPFAREMLAAMPARPALPPADIPTEPPASDAAGLGTALGHMLRGRFPTLSVRTGSPGGDPACFLQFQLATLPATLAVYLVSQDLRAFKVLLAWRRPFDGSLASIRLGGYEATVMSARLPGLSLAREVHLPEMPNDGFTQMSDGIASELATRLSVALVVARRLSVLVAD